MDLKYFIIILIILICIPIVVANDPPEDPRDYELSEFLDTIKDPKVKFDETQISTKQLLALKDNNLLNKIDKSNLDPKTRQEFLTKVLGVKQGSDIQQDFTINADNSITLKCRRLLQNGPLCIVGKISFLKIILS